MQKIVNDLKYDFMEVQPHEDTIDEKTKRVWQIVYVYRKGRLIAEGRAACCLADIKDKLFDVEQGYEIATGRAKIAVEKKRSYGHLPGGYYKGAYYGERKQKDTFAGIGLAALEYSLQYVRPNYCPGCGRDLTFIRTGKPPIESLVTSNIEDIKAAVKKCARQQ